MIYFGSWYQRNQSMVAWTNHGSKSVRWRLLYLKDRKQRGRKKTGIKYTQ
jgi:hypothetical protein